MLPSPRPSPRGGSSPYSLPPRPFAARGSVAASPAASPRPPLSGRAEAAPPPPSADEQWAELERAAAAFREASPAPPARKESARAELAPATAEDEARADKPPLPPLPPAAPAAASGGGRTPRTPRTPRARLAQVVPLPSSACDDDDAQEGPAYQAAPPAGPATPASPRGGHVSRAPADAAAGGPRLLASADVAARDGALHTARDALFAAQLAPRWPASRSRLEGDDDPSARESAWVRALLALRRPARAVAADAARAALLGAYLLTGAAVAFAALYRVDGATGRVQPL